MKLSLDRVCLATTQSRRPGRVRFQSSARRCILHTGAEKQVEDALAELQHFAPFRQFLVRTVLEPGKPIWMLCD